MRPLRLADARVDSNSFMPAGRRLGPCNVIGFLFWGAFEEVSPSSVSLALGTTTSIIAESKERKI